MNEIFRGFYSQDFFCREKIKKTRFLDHSDASVSCGRRTHVTPQKLNRLICSRSRIVIINHLNENLKNHRFSFGFYECLFNKRIFLNRYQKMKSLR